MRGIGAYHHIWGQIGGQIGGRRDSGRVAPRRCGAA